MIVQHLLPTVRAARRGGEGTRGRPSCETTVSAVEMMASIERRNRHHVRKPCTAAAGGGRAFDWHLAVAAQARRPRSMSASWASTGWWSTPSTTRLTSARWRRCLRRWPAPGTAPMVRIPWNTGRELQARAGCRRLGCCRAHGQQPEEAEQAVEAARYAPLGNRSVGGGRHAMSFGTTRQQEYYGARQRRDLARTPDRAHRRCRERRRDHERTRRRRMLHWPERPRRLDGSGAWRAAGE